MSEFARYEQMRDGGANPQQVDRAAKSEKVDFISRIKLLRMLFNLPLLEAKEICIVTDGLGNSLDDYQAKLAVGLEKALTEFEEELTSNTSEDQKP